MPKLRITAKILLALSGLSLVSLLLFGYIAFRAMDELGDFSLKRSLELGEVSVSDSKKALSEQAEENLLRLAKDQADISNVLFEDVEEATSVMAEFATYLWHKRILFSYRKSYSRSEEPPDIYAYSVYSLAPGVRVEYVTDDINLTSHMDLLFTLVYRNAHDHISEIYIGTEKGVFRVYPWDDQVSPSFDPRQRSWYQSVAQTGKMGWTDPYVSADKKGLMVTCSAPVYGPEGELVAVVGADVTMETLTKEIIATQIGETGHAFLLDNKGNVIAHPSLEAGDTKWDEEYITDNLLESTDPEVKKVAQDMIAGNTGIVRFEGNPETGNDDEYLAYAPVESTGWSLGIIMPVKEIIAPAMATQDKITSVVKETEHKIDQQIKFQLGILVLVLVVIVLLVTAAAVRLSKKITRPILALDEGARIVGDGNLDHILHIKTGDEIEDLAATFNRMTQDLKVYIKDLQETTAAKERIESELKVAHEIQTGMLPRIFPPFPERKEIDIFATMDPAKEVGGDLYDFFFIDRSRLCFLIGDVSGKGVPAALFMAISKILFKTEALQGLPPDQILSRVNNILAPDNDNCMFVTTFCVILDTDTGQIQFSNGGHNPPLIYRGQGGFEFLDIPKGFVVGAVQDSKFALGTQTLKKGDIIFLYTDGVTEAMDPKEELFSDKRLRDCLSSLKDKEITDIIHGIREEIRKFAQDAPQSDDITMLALKYKGGPAEGESSFKTTEIIYRTKDQLL